MELRICGSVVHQEADMTTPILENTCQSIISKSFKLQHHTAGARRSTGMLKSVIGCGTYFDLVYSR
jgi:hypothetical protein